MDPNTVKESKARAILTDAALNTYYEAREQAGRNDPENFDRIEHELWRCFGEALRGIELWICAVYHKGFPPEQADERFMEYEAQQRGLGSNAPSAIIDRELAREYERQL
jgi:hypothetical protein